MAAAEKAATFILQKLAKPDGRLLHTWRHGQAKLAAYLDDYAYFINSLVTLYEATFNECWIDEAVRLADFMLGHFEDHNRGGFFFTSDEHETLITRNKDLHDASVPSGNAMAATALLRLGTLCGQDKYLTAAERTLVFSLPVLERQPGAAGQMLIALDLWRGPRSELVLVGGSDRAENQRAIAAVQQAYLPGSVVAYRAAVEQGGEAGGSARSAHLDALFQARTAGGKVSLYVCQNNACQAPVAGERPIAEALKGV